MRRGTVAADHRWGARGVIALTTEGVERLLAFLTTI